MTRDWYPLDPSCTAGVEELGGKGRNLVALLRAGFCVPSGIVLGATLFDALHRRGAPLDAEGESRLRAVLVEALRAFPPDARLAVRSSGTDEDGGDASFAGQHATVLGVQGLDATVQAVKACWASLDSETAGAYRAARGAASRARMAVIVQRMVEAECAGVMFTRHPVRPDLDRVVVEAVAGLGEALVSGTVTPDRVELGRDGRRLREAARCAAGASSLDRLPAVDFVALAERVEAAFGGRPQDVEWAHDGETLYLLQARPITTLARPREAWTRVWGDEFWAEATTPMQYTCLGRWIREDYFRAVRELGGVADMIVGEPFTRIHSHIYFSSNYLYQMVPLIPPSVRIPRFFGWMPPYWLAELPTLPSRPGRALWAQVRARLHDPRASMLRHHTLLEGYIASVEGALAGTLGDDLGRLSDAALWRRLERADDLGRAHFRFIRWGMGSYLFPLKLMAVRAGMDWAGDPQGYATERLLTAPEDNRTVAVNRALEALAASAREVPELAAAFVRAGAGGARLTRAHCEAVPGSAPFLARLDAFLEAHGHRGTSRELHLPRWMDDPSLVLDLVTALLSRGPLPRSPEPVRDESAVDAWVAAIRASHPLLGLARAWWSARTLRLARAYVAYRESQRYALDFILTEVRHLMLEVGGRLTRRGVLRRADDVFFLEWEELRALWARRDAHPAALDLEARRAELLRDAAALPADWIIDGVEYGGASADDDGDADRLFGTGASAGKVRGRARVVRTPEALGRVRDGDVLVAPNTDPGWTPVFPLLRGLVLETGGILSHGAIVAREYGIPAVTGVPRACARLRDGELLEVDGASGVVRRIAEPA